MGSSPTGASPTGSTPTTIYILMHNFIISYRAGFNLSLEQKVIFNWLIWYQTYLDMWSIFGVKLDYIVIFEKSCNSSTLLIEHCYSLDRPAQVENWLIQTNDNISILNVQFEWNKI